MADSTCCVTSPRKRLMIFSGRSNPVLAAKIADKLDVAPGNVELKTFSNGEIYARFEENVRGSDMFIVQSPCDDINGELMELLIMIQAAQLASAKRITAVMPYYPYSRQDKKSAAREPITARLVATLLEASKVDRVLSMDLHQGQIQGFFNIPVGELTAVHMLSRYFNDKHLEDCVVVTDLGFAKRARAFAELVDAPLAIVEKRRHGNLDRAEVMNVIGDVRGLRAIIVDDEVDTGGTLIEITRALER